MDLTPTQRAALDLACERGEPMIPESKSLRQAFRCLWNGGYLKRVVRDQHVCYMVTPKGYAAQQWSASDADTP